MHTGLHCRRLKPKLALPAMTFLSHWHHLGLVSFFFFFLKKKARVLLPGLQVALCIISATRSCDSIQAVQHAVHTLTYMHSTNPIACATNLSGRKNLFTRLNCQPFSKVHLGLRACCNPLRGSPISSTARLHSIVGPRVIGT
jgi:hypothetical protein